jgi:hypothetical protein
MSIFKLNYFQRLGIFSIGKSQEINMQLSAPQYVVKVFGGVRKTAKAVERDPSAVSKWIHETGNIPSSIQRKILELAKRDGLDITPNDLIYGRAVKK